MQNRGSTHSFSYIVLLMDALTRDSSWLQMVSQEIYSVLKTNSVISQSNACKNASSLPSMICAKTTMKTTKPLPLRQKRKIEEDKLLDVVKAPQTLVNPTGTWKALTLKVLLMLIQNLAVPCL